MAIRIQIIITLLLCYNLGNAQSQPDSVKTDLDRCLEALEIKQNEVKDLRGVINERLSSKSLPQVASNYPPSTEYARKLNFVWHRKKRNNRLIFIGSILATGATTYLITKNAYNSR